MSRCHTDKPPKVLAISSGGGHWTQLLRLRPAFDHCQLSYATVHSRYHDMLDNDTDFHLVKDCNRERPLRMLSSILSVVRLIMKVRPDVIITTGAATGLLALVVGKLYGSKTIWIDSIANSESISLSGRFACFADHWLTQWPELSQPGGPKFHGQVWG